MTVSRQPAGSALWSGSSGGQGGGDLSGALQVDLRDVERPRRRIREGDRQDGSEPPLVDPGARSFRARRRRDHLVGRLGLQEATLRPEEDHGVGGNPEIGDIPLRQWRRTSSLALGNVAQCSANRPGRDPEHVSRISRDHRKDGSSRLDECAGQRPVLGHIPNPPCHGVPRLLHRVGVPHPRPAREDSTPRTEVAGTNGPLQ